MAPHSSTLAWKIPWTEEPGRLQSVGSLRVGHDWSNLAAAAAARFCRTHRVSFHLFGHYCSLNYRMPRSLVAYPPNTSHTLHAPGPPVSSHRFPKHSWRKQSPSHWDPVNKALRKSTAWGLTGSRPSARQERNVVKKKKNKCRDFPGFQGLRIHLPKQGTWLRSLVQKDPTCPAVTKSQSHNCWAHVLLLLKPAHLSACASQQEKPRQ